jgi:hypothetical protein
MPDVDYLKYERYARVSFETVLECYEISIINFIIFNVVLSKSTDKTIIGGLWFRLAKVAHRHLGGEISTWWFGASNDGLRARNRLTRVVFGADWLTFRRVRTLF